jgi:hypothetical protein
VRINAPTAPASPVSLRRQLDRASALVDIVIIQAIVDEVAAAIAV